MSGSGGEPPRKRAQEDYSHMPPSKRALAMSHNNQTNIYPSISTATTSASTTSEDIKPVSTVIHQPHPKHFLSEIKRTESKPSVVAVPEPEVKSEPDEPEEFAGIEIGNHQKKQLVLKVGFQKQQLADANHRYKTLEKKVSRLEHAVGVIEGHWEALNEDLLTQFSKINPKVIEDHLEPDSSSGAVSAYIDQLKLTEDPDNMREEVLLGKCNASRDLVVKVIDAVETQSLNNQKLYELLRDQISDADAFDMIRVDNENLHKQNRILQNQVDKLVAKTRHAIEDKNRIREMGVAAKEGREALEERIELLTDGNEKIYRQVRKLTQNLNELNASRPSGNSTSSDTVKTEDSTSTIKQEISSADVKTELGSLSECGVASTTTTNMEDFRIKYEDAVEESARRLSELEALRKERANILSELDRMKLVKVPEQTIMESPRYKIVLSQFASVSKQLADLRQTYERSQVDSQELSVGRRNDFEIGEVALLDTREKYEKEIKESEHKMQHLRNERDRYKRLCEQLKLKNDSENSRSATAELIRSMQTATNMMMSDLKRNRGNKAKEQNAVGESVQNEPQATNKIPDRGSSVSNSVGRSASLADASVDGKVNTVVDTAEVEKLTELLRLEKMKVNEVNTLLGVYKSTSKLSTSARDSLVNERKLTEQVSELKKKLSKYQRDEHERRSSKSDRVSEKELKQSIQEKDEELEVFMTEMESISKAYDEVQEHNTRLLKQITNLEDNNVVLVSQMNKTKTNVKLLGEAKAESDAKVRLLNEQVEAANALVKALEEKEKALKDQTAILEKDAWSRQQALDINKKKALEASQSEHELKLQLDEAEEKNASLDQLISKKNETMEQEEHQKARLLEDIKKLEKQVSRAGPGGITDVEEVLEEEVRTYKEMVMCSLCKRRKKNTILTKCQHVFCNVCIQDRYESRQRKCPNCLDPFGLKDTSSIYLF
eukprot:CFRG6374T1